MARADAPGGGLVLGTAGHIDHGKTALIRALTGVDTDRLPEEKARGITIDLGFAALDLDDGRLSVVDVPGHERLVRTMVSGAAGIDLVLLVVAADEGVMPQTREHVAICDLLGIERGVVALTKRDLVDEEMCELAGEELRDLLASTSLAEAPIVPVSSTTGEGLDGLREALENEARSGAPRTARSGVARLPIDRSFAIQGFGSVVTGTLVGGAFEVGETVEIYPSGQQARIRGLQSHDVSVQRAEPGRRCAINLQGLDVADLHRGDVVARPDALAPTRSADVRIDWLDGAPESEDTVAIEFLAGSAERRARLAVIGESGFKPGHTHFARLHVDGDPVPLLPGDRFIARGFARIPGAGKTLGGGVVLDIAPPRRRRSDPELLRELEVFARGDLRDALRERVARRGLAGIESDELARAMGLARAEVEAQLESMAEDCARAGPGLWLAAAAVERMEETLVEALTRFHADEPLRPGMPRAALRGQLPANVRPEAGALALARLDERGVLDIDADQVRLAGFAPALDEATRATLEQIRSEARAAGLEPPNPRDWAAALEVSLEHFRDLVAHLEREGELVRAPGDLWFARAAVDELRARVVAHLEEHRELDTQTYKQLIATTRRTAMPLMELLDELHVTRRSGEVRILRGGGSA